MKLKLILLTFSVFLYHISSKAQTVLCGMTFNGGLNYKGVLFEYVPTTNTYTKKFELDSVNGSYPQASPIKASNGKLYGMTSSGGSSNSGVLFEYDPSTSIYTKKMDFNGVANGSSPYGCLVQASNGKLYGITTSGGTNSAGVLFEYDPLTSTYIKKIDFITSPGSNGYNPRGSLVQAPNGKLYGVASGGGSSNKGVLFEYDPVTSTYTKKIDFNGAGNGSIPYGSLMKSTDGKLYGMTKGGGTSNLGVLFEYDPTNNSIVVKFNFTGTSGLNKGSGPTGSLIQASNSKLYGMTNLGGSNDKGVLFEYELSTSTYLVLKEFDGINSGEIPYGSLMETSNGILYGMTHGGGLNNYGILFEYIPISGTFNKKIDFNFSDGAFPYYGQLLELSNSTGVNENEDDNNNINISIFPNPSDGNIKMKYMFTKEKEKIEVFNINGQLVYENNENRIIGTNTVELQLSHLCSGNYTIKVGLEKIVLRIVK